ncbi:MAG: EAL domain-containing protein [Gammaproteobacteria bacterium]|nr:EAL domain-containing protein [Gammaproteobacteria bacterium]MBU1415262.1 EAL domain-containing protein [Gammaproteobacteria bacterium]
MMQRPLGMLLLTLVSILILTALFVRAGSVSHERHHQYTLELRSLREADAEIAAEVLASRLELSRNYDALTEHVQRAMAASNRITSVPEFLSVEDRAAVQKAATELQALLAEKAELVDLFKRDNAVLRNSLAYFPVAVNAYFGTRHTPAIGQLVGRYARHLLAYARMPDADNKRLVMTSADRLRVAVVAGKERRVVDNLLLHGDLIVERLENVEALSRQLLADDSARKLEFLYQSYGRGYTHAEADAEHYRILLYVLALALVAYLAVTALRLSRARRSLAEANRELNERYAAQLLVEDRLRLHTTAFDNSHEGITLTNARGEILDVNPAFTRITGYERSEVIGRNPRVLKSGRHDPAFYEAMWKSITEKGTWRGEIWNRSKFGDVYPELLSIAAVHDADGQLTNFVAVFSDISRLKEQEKQLVQMAYFDALTGLPNRALLADRIVQASAQTRRSKKLMALCYLDLDGFKPINDTWGHDVGDQLLIEVANRFKATLRAGDTVARLGGDEFVLLMLGLEDIAECEQAVQRMLHAVGDPLLVAPQPVTLSASVGVAIFPLDDGDADTLLRHADQAMYRAKQSGKNRFHVFDPDQDRFTRSRYDRVARIQDALDYNEIVLYYQPKVDMRAGRVAGVEALIRWQHPERGLLLPSEFLPLIEDHDMVIRVGEWVIEAALTQMDAWLAQGLRMPVSVNIAGRQLQSPGFVQRLSDALARHPQAANLLEMEVLETSALEDMVKVSRVIEECNQLGVSFSLDDFGTGYSSLTYLKRLPVASIKIDQSFVGEMFSDPDNLVIVQGVIGLTNAFQRHAIAEGVETVEHGRLLLQLDCDYAQGFGIAKPMPGEEMLAWVEAWRPDPRWQEIAGLRWDVADYPMLTAEVEHRNWVTQVVYAARQGLPMPHRRVGDAHFCRFGKWYDGADAERYQAFPVFGRIAAEHHGVHEIAETMDTHMRDGRADEARAMIGALLARQGAVLALIQELQIQVAKRR